MQERVAGGGSNNPTRTSFRSQVSHLEALAAELRGEVDRLHLQLNADSLASE
ncbi:hypothetical protein JNW90_23640 [Micromonospora sp. STR1s_5]|nr:hypothetical protein [Micromonospora sp. STR1s_5]